MGDGPQLPLQAPRPPSAPSAAFVTGVVERLPSDSLAAFYGLAAIESDVLPDMRLLRTLASGCADPTDEFEQAVPPHRVSEIVIPQGLSIDALHAVAAVVAVCPNLRSVMAADSGIGDAGVELLVEALAHVPEIGTLNFSNCNITDDGGIQLLRLIAA